MSASHKSTSVKFRSVALPAGEPVICRSPVEITREGVVTCCGLVAAGGRCERCGCSWRGGRVFS